MAGSVKVDVVEADSSSDLTLKSGIASKPPVIRDVAGTEVGTFCRAWVNFNGTGTVAIRASFNVSSITDTGVGQYTINFTNAMSDINYATTMTCQDTGVPMLGTTDPVATGSVKMLVCVRGSTSAVDPVVCCAAIFR